VATRGAFFTDQLQARLRRLEAELEEYPDQRSEILLEIATARRKLGETDRAVDIWRYLIAQGGEDGDYARVELAEHLFGKGQDEDARAELAAIKAAGRTSSGAWTSVAELLEDRGELAEALVWYRMARHKSAGS
jgi:tetratricopeptide (TPR) repeat protein